MFFDDDIIITNIFIRLALNTFEYYNQRFDQVEDFKSGAQHILIY